MQPEPAIGGPYTAETRANRPSVALYPFARVLGMESAKQLNKRASAKFARYQNRIGRPVPKSWADRTPDPGTWADDDPELG